MNKNDLVSNMFTLKDFLKVTGLKLVEAKLHEL